MTEPTTAESPVLNRWATLILPLIVIMTLSTPGCIAQESNFYEIDTSYGKMVVRLYDETPIHRDNFKKLVAEGFYDNTLFHRVIENFMVQGGDPNSKDDDPTNDGLGGPGYTIAAEFNPNFIHKKGAIAAARQGGELNPDRESSGSQFYIVHGEVYTDEILSQIETMIKKKAGSDFQFTEDVRRIYATEGGTPQLDMDYTVFGEIVEGLDVLDAIANTDTPKKLGQPAPRGLADRPTEDIRITIRHLPNYSAN